MKPAPLARAEIGTVDPVHQTPVGFASLSRILLACFYNFGPFNDHALRFHDPAGSGKAGSDMMLVLSTGSGSPSNIFEVSYEGDVAFDEDF